MKKNKVPVYTCLIVVLTILIGICLFFMYYLYDVSHSLVNFSEIIYNESSRVNYQVKLSNNEYYENPTDTDTYIVNTLNDIDAFFHYTLSFNENVRGEYKYTITGKLTNYIRGTNDMVYSKELYRTNASEYTVDGRVIELNGDFNIPASAILNEYNKFKNDYKTDTVGMVEYTITIDYRLYNATIDKEFSDTTILTLDYDLGNQTTKVNTSKKVNEDKRIFSDATNEDNKLYIAIYLEFSGAIILFVILIMLLMKKIINSKSHYRRIYNRILKKYGSEIIAIKDLPDLTDINVIKLTNFKDMLDMHHNLKMPIMYNEVIPERETVYLIVKDTHAYVYKLSYKDVEDL